MLFLLPVLIWGSTWYVITFQLGKADPLASVAWRFLASAAIILIFCAVTRKPLRFSASQHARIALLGALQFGFNYWMVYMAEEIITSGLVAIAFSTIVFYNMIFGAIFLGRKIQPRVMIGAILGLIGTGIIFSEELLRFEMAGENINGLILGVGSVIVASLGNITSAKNSSMNIPVVQSTGFGMAYGGLIMFLIALVLDRPLTIDTSTSYLVSMAYLVIFGSIIAFVSYLTLISKIGPDKAAYAIVLVPLVAVTISTIQEGFPFTIFTALGMALLLSGNLMALSKKKIQSA